MVKPQKISVEVAYAGNHKQAIIPITIERGTTVLQAIEQSQILLFFPEIIALEGHVGIFGKLIPLETSLKEGDRIEIYRSLKQDPKEARRKRSQKRQK